MPGNLKQKEILFVKAMEDLEAAKTEWGLVLKLAPGSDLAQTVKVHMDGLTAATPTPTPAATPIP